MIGGAKGIGIGIDFGIPNQYCRATSKPYIEKDVLDSLRVVASAYGKSNDDADRSIVKNLVDASNPFIISNAAFKLNSGFGEYEQDFTDWEKSSKVTSFDSESIKFTSDATWTLLYYSSSIGEDIPSFKVRIKLYGESTLYYNYITQEGKYTNVAIKSEIFETPICYNTKYTGEKRVNVGFTLGVTSGECSGTITQIPSFEGAFVTDGINDLITSTKTVQEMLGGSTEFTTVSMIHLISPGQDIDGAAYTNYIRTSDNYWTSNRVSNIDKTGIYGYSFKQGTPTVIDNILGDKNDYTTDKSPDTSEMFRAKFSIEGFEHVTNGAVHVSSVAWYWTIIANKVLTTDQINQVIAYFNLDRTLKPDILCNTIKQGITNENHAEFGDKLIDFSGNGRDIQLNNIAWKGDSGIGKYETELSNTSIWTQSKETTSSPFSSSYNGLSGWIVFANTELTNSADIPSFKIQVKGLLEGQELIYRYYDSNGQSNVYSMGKDGEYTLPSDVRTAKPQTSNTSGFQVVKNETNIITITQIPSHAGALCLDGVNDFGKVTGMPVYKDYTVVTDREIFANTGAISSKNNPGAFVETAGNSVYSFGQATSGLNFISTRSISYLSKYSYCGQSITAGAAEDGTDMWLGTIRDNDHRFFNGAIYSLMSFPYSMSEFLIERQLKKHKLGTLYPDMVEFRPIVKSNVKWDTIEIWQGDKSLYRPAVNDDKTGIYLKKNSTIGIYVKPNVGQKVSEIVCNGVSYTDLKINSNGFYYKIVPITKSPQKINVAIEQDENYVLFNPVITSNVEYHRLDFYLNNYEKRINIGDYIPKGVYIRANFYLKNNVDELTVFTFNGVNISYRKSSVDDTAFNIGHIYNYDSPQEVNITIDEYIRYEEIVQPYPVIFQITDRNTNQRYSWGDKIKVGSSIRLSQGEKTNLLSGLYSIQSYEYEGETYSYNQLTNLNIILTKQSISLSCNKTWLLDDNEPKCILSPRLLRIPNSSYKILGYIPDISGHGNHGVIHNSAYAEGSGANEDGSYQFDGVDDFVTIPTLSSGGKQVLMKVNQSNIDSCLYTQVEAGIGQDRITTALPNSLAYQGRWEIPNWSKVYIDAIENNYITNEQLYNITHIITAVSSNSVKTTTPIIGALRVGNSLSTFAQMSLYDFMLFDEISTDEEIATLNEYIGIEPKVTVPPYYWDAYGKANNNADDIEGTRHALWNKANLTDAGEALICNNIGYDEMSGYGGYSFNSFDTASRWNVYPNSGQVAAIEIISRNGYSITLKKKLEDIYSWQFNNGSTVTNLSEDLKFNVKCDKPIKVIWQLKYRLVAGEAYRTETISTDDLTANVEANLTLLHKTPAQLEEMGVIQHYYLIYFNNAKLAIDEEYTITMLPLYPNGCCLDGIDDYLFNANIPALTDFTVIAKREWFNKSKYLNECFAHKGIISTPIRETAFMLEYEIGNDTYYRSSSYGGYINVERSNRPEKIVYQTPTSYNGTSITRGSGTDTTGLTIGAVTNNYWKGVFYKMMLYPKTLTNLEIMFLKNLFERDEIIDLTNPIFIQK